MELMGVKLESRPSWGGILLWEGSCGDWKFQVRKISEGDRTFLQVRVTQVYTWSSPGPTIHADTTTPEVVLWRHTFPVSKEDSDEKLQSILDGWFKNELRALGENRARREASVVDFLRNGSENWIL
jgi:hypothetical protein